MLFNSTKLMLANTMMIGVIMVICTNNWISMWMGMEISMLSFIPFMQNKVNLSSESMVKYFIIQSIASTLFMFSVICLLIGVNMTNEEIMTISMLIKLGSAPFHNWVMMIIENMNYLVLFNLLTTIKIPPLIILYNINSKMLMMPIILSMMIGSFMCMNQSSLRKTLAFSSIYNLSMMMISMNKTNIIMTYFTIYSIMMANLMFLVEKMKINFINQMVFNEFSIWIKLNLWINMLSMGGFPPLMGFLAKMMVLQNLMYNDQKMLTIIMLTTSILVMLFYMRLAFTSMLSTHSFKKWNIINKTKTMKFIMSMNLTASPMILTMKSLF